MWEQGNTKMSSECAQTIETWGDNNWLWLMWAQSKAQRASETSQTIKHEGINFNCDKCDFKAATKQAFKYHKQSKHSGTNMTLLNVSTKRHQNVIRECTSNLYMGNQV